MYAVTEKASPYMEYVRRTSTINTILTAVFEDLKKRECAEQLVIDMAYTHERLLRRNPYRSLRHAKQKKVIEYFMMGIYKNISMTKLAKYLHVNYYTMRSFILYLESFGLISRNTSDRTHYFTWMGHERKVIH